MSPFFFQKPDESDMRGTGSTNPKSHINNHPFLLGVLCVSVVKKSVAPTRRPAATGHEPRDTGHKSRLRRA
jgi:hypothetical protein